MASTIAAYQLRTSCLPGPASAVLPEGYTQSGQGETRNQADREADSEADSQADSETDSQADREPDREGHIVTVSKTESESENSMRIDLGLELL